ncbi:hypothetical protein [Moorena producens]|uniref:hypothetical protein n=1 Tax=Moorena producens TaxID=1155739 RepID=UPI003C738F5F
MTWVSIDLSATNTIIIAEYLEKRNRFSPQFLRVRSYRKNKAAFMVGRLWIKEVRPVANLIRLRKAHLWLKLYD